MAPADHTINVEFMTAERVRVVPNPLPGKPQVAPGGNPPKPIKDGETIEWVNAKGIEVQVLFLKVDDFSGAAAKPCNPLGPFGTVSSSEGRTVGTVRPTGAGNKRFTYQLFSDGKKLTFDNPVMTAVIDGGIDIPMTPG